MHVGVYDCGCMDTCVYMGMCTGVCVCVCVTALDRVLPGHGFSSAVCVALGRDAGVVQLSSNIPSIPTRPHTLYTCTHTAHVCTHVSA